MQIRSAGVGQWLHAPPQWEAVVLPFSPLPRLDATRGEIGAEIQRIAQRARNEWKLEAEIFVEITPLSLSPDGPRIIADNGADWLPEMGLGVWPDQPPPTLWTVDELWNLPLGQTPRPIMDQMLQLTGEKRESALGLLGGLGSLLVVMAAAGGAEKMLEGWTANYLPRMHDPLFKDFPFYVPLLKKETVEAAAPGKLEQWLSGARFYMRECKEDQTLLILADRPLAGILEM